MNLTQYQQDVKRTFKDAGDLLRNSIHMTDGMNTELGEINECLFLKDPGHAFDHVNLREEAGDLTWYNGNFGNLWSVDLNEIPFKQNYYFSGGVNVLTQLQICIARLMDYDKKELAYGKAKNLETIQECFRDVLRATSDFFLFYGIDPEAAMDININKLKARYPEKFTEEKAINRNLDAERAILEQ